MHDDSALVAIDAALHSPAYCACGESLEVTTRGASVLLECPAFGRPSHLPAALASFLRELLHARRFVSEIPTDLMTAPDMPSSPAGPRALALHA